MDKQHIINEIKRTAEKNNGIPLGTERFYAETGIRKTDWYGKYWALGGEMLLSRQDTYQTSYRDHMKRNG